MSGIVRETLKLSGFPFAMCLILLSCSKTDLKADIINQPVTHIIEIKKFKFVPEILHVREGDFVRWENKDIVPHQIAEKTLKKWKSKDLLPTESFVLQIDGSTSYICKLHPIMKAKIIIQRNKLRG